MTNKQIINQLEIQIRDLTRDVEYESERKQEARVELEGLREKHSEELNRLIRSHGHTTEALEDLLRSQTEQLRFLRQAILLITVAPEKLNPEILDKMSMPGYVGEYRNPDGVREELLSRR